MTDQTNGGFWDGLQTRIFQSLDYIIADEWGNGYQVQPGYMPTGYQYPEQVPPSADNPTEPWFEFGNNAGTWAAGLALVAVGYLAYRAMK